MLSHKQKVRLARSHLTRDEIKERVPIFQSKYWEARKARIEREVAKREDHP
jgi:hypothetical protein